MLMRNCRLASALALSAGLPIVAGCCATRETAQGPGYDTYETTYHEPAPQPERRTMAMDDAWPMDAQPGECFARVFIPPPTETIEERVLVKEASERLEIQPAQYEWVEERVLVKDASKQLEEIPAQYEWRDQTVEVKSGRQGWVMGTKEDCEATPGDASPFVICLVDKPATTKTVRKQVLVQAAQVREVEVPAEYETVRRQRLVQPAVARRVTVPAEYETVQRTVVTGPGRMEWRRIECDLDATASAVVNIKTALIAAGYEPGPLNGEMNEQYWNALRAYQADHGVTVTPAAPTTRQVASN